MSLNLNLFSNRGSILLFLLPRQVGVSLGLVFVQDPDLRMNSKSLLLLDQDQEELLHSHLQVH
jgi:hypothetical protein